MAKRSSANTDGALQMGGRIAEIASVTGLNQKSFADRLGVSQGFISSVVNDQAVPGSDFLFALNAEFGVSTDWVLTGKGGMYGEGQIDITLFKEIRLLVAVARAATVENDPMAKAVVLLANSDGLEKTSNDETLRAYLNGLTGRDCDIELVIALYNRYLVAYSQRSSRRQVIADTIGHFQLLQPVDLSKEPAVFAAKAPQVNISGGSNIRNAGRDYYENLKQEK
jgi:transcriptional regulator with XRE-family HTH domain